MLEFNPYFRPTAKELLKNPIFDEIRIEENETISPHKIVLGFDRGTRYQIDEDDEPEKEA